MPRTSAEEMIKRLEAKIQSIKDRAERKKAKTNPAVKFMSRALRSIDQALNSTDDAVLRKALDEARETVASCLALVGVKKRAPRNVIAPRTRGKASSKVDPDRVLTFLERNQGSRSEQISAAFDTDAAALRPVLNSLIEEGKIRTEGERRGRRYFVSA